MRKDYSRGKFTLLKQIQWKLEKGKIAEQIAEELEEPLENIMQICATIEEYGLDAYVRLIYDCLYVAQPEVNKTIGGTDINYKL